MNAFSRSIEPHTSYLSPRNAERFQMEMNLSLKGLVLNCNLKTITLLLKLLIAGRPCGWQRKLSPEDKIVGVGQEGGEIWLM